MAGGAAGAASNHLKVCSGPAHAFHQSQRNTADGVTRLCRQPVHPLRHMTSGVIRARDVPRVLGGRLPMARRHHEASATSHGHGLNSTEDAASQCNDSPQYRCTAGSDAVAQGGVPRSKVEPVCGEPVAIEQRLRIALAAVA